MNMMEYSSNSQQEKLNKQRQMIRENQKKKQNAHMLTLKSSGMDSARSLGKEEKSPLVIGRNRSNQNARTNHSQFAYDGPQAYEMLNSEKSLNAQVQMLRVTQNHPRQSHRHSHQQRDHNADDREHDSSIRHKRHSRNSNEFSSAAASGDDEFRDENDDDAESSSSRDSSSRRNSKHRQSSKPYAEHHVSAGLASANGSAAGALRKSNSSMDRLSSGGSASGAGRTSSHLPSSTSHNLRRPNNNTKHRSSGADADEERRKRKQQRRQNKGGGDKTFSDNNDKAEGAQNDEEDDEDSWGGGGGDEDDDEDEVESIEVPELSEDVTRQEASQVAPSSQLSGGGDASTEESKPGDSDKPSSSRAAIDPSKNLEAFAFEPAPQGFVVKCRITRDKKGMDKGIFPTYYLHWERDDGKRIFLLAARRRKMKKTSNYLISCDATDMARDSDSFLGKLRSNFLGTQFTIYDNGDKLDGGSGGATGTANSSVKPGCRREMASIIYDTNVMGFKGPRKMTAIIPGMNSNHERIEFYSSNMNNGGLSLIDCWKKNVRGNWLELHNKTPVWNEDTQSYVLNFHSRVTQASVKNFQIVHDNDVDYIVMQFGRVGEDAFTMDYAYPMCAIQAFAVALSSFDSKLACE